MLVKGYFGTKSRAGDSVGKWSWSNVSYTSLLLQLVLDARVIPATRNAEWEATMDIILNTPGKRRINIEADTGYDTEGFMATLRSMSTTPHLAQNDTNRRSVIDSRTTRHPGHEVSSKASKRIEEIFGWIKTVGPLLKARYRGIKKLL